MSRRSHRDAAPTHNETASDGRPGTDVAVTRLLWLAGLWLGSRLVAGLLVAPFVDPGAPLSAGSLVVSQIPFWGVTVGGLWWMARREGERLSGFVRWGFALQDLGVGLVAEIGRAHV